MENDQEYMKGLYERFRNEITQGLQPDYYDRDELLDIYDYAQDEADVMTQMYVFLVAARLYPDADSFLGERIGFFVSYLDSRAGMDLLQRKGRPDTPLWDVLALGVKHYPDGDPAADLDTFFKKHQRIDSESVIKLVDLLREMERPDLLLLHFEDLRRKVEDPQGLLFEAAESFRNAGEPYLDKARGLAEELTEKEPFNIDNWVLLSKIQFQRQDAEEAISAADYAAALDPDFRAPKILHALGMVMTGKDRSEAIEKLRDLIHEQPDDAVAFRGLVEALKQEGRNEEAVEEYLRLWRTDASNLATVLPQILAIGMSPKQTEIVAELLVDSFGDDENRYVEMARGIIHQGFDSGALFVLECYDRKYGLFYGAEMVIGLYYRLRRYADLIRFFKECCYRNHAIFDDNKALSTTLEGLGATDNVPPAQTLVKPAEPLQLSTTAFLFFASSALLTRDFETARMVADMVLATPDSHYENLDLYERITLKGIISIMHEIKNYADNPSTIPDNPDFDPIEN